MKRVPDGALFFDVQIAEHSMSLPKINITACTLLFDFVFYQFWFF